MTLIYLDWDGIFQSVALHDLFFSVTFDNFVNTARKKLFN